MRLFAALLLISACALACETDLDVAYDEFRAQAPAVCKDYCEEKVACEGATGEGTYAREAFTAEVHECVALCGAYAAEGAYAWQPNNSDTSDRYYTAYISGSTLITGFECLYNMGAYRCVNEAGATTGTTPAYIHRLNAPVPSVCDGANACVSSFAVDYVLFWQADSSGIGGNCIKSGYDNIDAMMF